MTFAINVTGGYLVADEAAKTWREQGLPGTLVLTTSANAVVAKKGSVAYDCSKAAANHLVRELAVELAPLVRVNGVAPATVVRRLRRVRRDRGDGRRLRPERRHRPHPGRQVGDDVRRQRDRRLPRRRRGGEDVARARAARLAGADHECERGRGEAGERCLRLLQGRGQPPRPRAGRRAGPARPGQRRRPRHCRPGQRACSPATACSAASRSTHSYTDDEPTEALVAQARRVLRRPHADQDRRSPRPTRPRPCSCWSATGWRRRPARSSPWTAACTRHSCGDSPMINLSHEARVETAFAFARERYAELGVDADAALAALAAIPVSLHCWQGDDVGGFEDNGRRTRRRAGRHRQLPRQGPHRRRTPPGRRPGVRRSSPARTGSTCTPATWRPPAGVDRDDVRPEHFARWVDWAKERRHRPRLQPDVLRPPDGGRRVHARPPRRRRPPVLGRPRRRLPADRGALRPANSARRASPTSGSPTGTRTLPVDRKAPRERLTRVAGRGVRRAARPAAQPGRGRGASCSASGRRATSSGRTSSTSATRSRRRKLLCLDAGHFHPTESIADKLSAVLPWLDGVLLHVSRGVRWDSDHVVTLTDDLHAIAQEVVRGGYLGRVHFGPGLLRRQHQPRGRVGDRHAVAAEGAARGPAGADGPLCGSWRRTATSPPGWRCWRS